MEFMYRALLSPDPDGGFVVSFPDVPEALTQGDDEQDALSSAQEALGLALRGILLEGRHLPRPVAQSGVPVAVDPETALKLATIEAFREAGISKVELARRLGKSENEARRILDPDHPSKSGALHAALQAMGRSVVVSILEAAE